jgi:toxin ParE1/3/4
VRVHWTTSATRHLGIIHEYVAQDSKIYADRPIDRLTRRSEQLGSFPESGRVVPEFRRTDFREVIEPPYRIVYRVRPDQIDVLAVIHGAREFRL